MHIKFIGPLNCLERGGGQLLFLLILSLQIYYWQCLGFRSPPKRHADFCFKPSGLFFFNSLALVSWIMTVSSPDLHCVWSWSPLCWSQCSPDLPCVGFNAVSSPDLPCVGLKAVLIFLVLASMQCPVLIFLVLVSMQCPVLISLVLVSRQSWSPLCCSQDSVQSWWYCALWLCLESWSPMCLVYYTKWKIKNACHDCCWLWIRWLVWLIGMPPSTTMWGQTKLYTLVVTVGTILPWLAKYVCLHINQLTPSIKTQYCFCI